MKIDPVVGETLLRLQEIVNKKHEIEKDQTLSPVEKSKKIQELTFKVIFSCRKFSLNLNYRDRVLKI